MAATYLVGQNAGNDVLTIRALGTGTSGDLGVQTNASGSTGAAVPSLATFGGMSVSGNLVGFTGTGTSLNVNLTTSSVAVTGTFWQATQPVSGTVAATQSGTWNIATVTTLTSITNAVAVTGTFYQATQPVSGTFWQATQPVSIAATVAVAGGKTNNSAAPGATNVGALVAVATTAVPTYTDTYNVALSTDLSGQLRIVGGKTNNAAAPTTNLGTLPAIATAAAPSWTEGYQVGLSTTLAGALRISGTVTGTATLTDAYANPTTNMQTGSFLMGWNGTTWDRVKTANTGRLQVDIVTGAGSNASVSTTGAAVPASATFIGMTQGGLLVALTGTSGNLNVNVANAAVPVIPAPTATPSVVQVASSATVVTLLALNTNRKGAMVMNDSTQTLYVKLGSAATATSYTVKMAADAYYEVPFGYTGVITGIWASANGYAYVTELTT